MTALKGRFYKTTISLTNDCLWDENLLFSFSKFQNRKNSGQFLIISLMTVCFSIQFCVQYNSRLSVSQLLSQIMLSEKYISTWHWENGLSCTSGGLAASWDFVLSGWLPGVKRGHTSQLLHKCPMYPHGQQDMIMILPPAKEKRLTNLYFRRPEKNESS